MDVIFRPFTGLGLVRTSPAPAHLRSIKTTGLDNETAFGFAVHTAPTQISW